MEHTKRILQKQIDSCSNKIKNLQVNHINQYNTVREALDRHYSNWRSEIVLILLDSNHRAYNVFGESGHCFEFEEIQEFLRIQNKINELSDTRMALRLNLKSLIF